MAFDRLIYIDRLKQAGPDDATARAHADALRDALIESVATKADLNDLRNEMQTELRELRAETKMGFADSRHEVNELRLLMAAEFKTSRADMQVMRAEMQVMRGGMQVISRDLLVKGAAALVVAMSLLISIKFFG